MGANDAAAALAASLLSWGRLAAVAAGVPEGAAASDCVAVVVRDSSRVVVQLSDAASAQADVQQPAVSDALREAVEATMCRGAADSCNATTVEVGGRRRRLQGRRLQGPSGDAASVATLTVVRERDSTAAFSGADENDRQRLARATRSLKARLSSLDSVPEPISKLSVALAALEGRVTIAPAASTYPSLNATAALMAISSVNTPLVESLDDSFTALNRSHVRLSKLELRTIDPEDGTALAASDMSSGMSSELSSELSGGAIAGLVVGILIGVCLLLLLIFFCLRMRRRKKEDAKKYGAAGGSGPAQSPSSPRRKAFEKQARTPDPTLDWSKTKLSEERDVHPPAVSVDSPVVAARSRSQMNTPSSVESTQRFLKDRRELFDMANQYSRRDREPDGTPTAAQQELVPPSSASNVEANLKRIRSFEAAPSAPRGPLRLEVEQLEAAEEAALQDVATAIITSGVEPTDEVMQTVAARMTAKGLTSIASTDAIVRLKSIIADYDHGGAEASTSGTSQVLSVSEGSPDPNPAATWSSTVDVEMPEDAPPPPPESLPATSTSTGSGIGASSAESRKITHEDRTASFMRGDRTKADLYHWYGRV